MNCGRSVEPLTNAQRQALHRQRRAEELERYRAALQDIAHAKTLPSAKKIAEKALLPAD